MADSNERKPREPTLDRATIAVNNMPKDPAAVDNGIKGARIKILSVGQSLQLNDLNARTTIEYKEPITIIIAGEHFSIIKGEDGIFRLKTTGKTPILFKLQPGKNQINTSTTRLLSRSPVNQIDMPSIGSNALMIEINGDNITIINNNRGTNIKIIETRAVENPAHPISPIMTPRVIAVHSGIETKEALDTNKTMKINIIGHFIRTFAGILPYEAASRIIDDIPNQLLDEERAIDLFEYFCNRIKSVIERERKTTFDKLQTYTGMPENEKRTIMKPYDNCISAIDGALKSKNQYKGLSSLELVDRIREFLGLGTFELPYQDVIIENGLSTNDPSKFALDKSAVNDIFATSIVRLKKARPEQYRNVFTNLCEDLIELTNRNNIANKPELINRLNKAKYLVGKYFDEKSDSFDLLTLMDLIRGEVQNFERQEFARTA